MLSRVILLFLVLFAMVGCRSATVHVVSPVRYRDLKYEDRAKYLGALHEANRRNLELMDSPTHGIKIKLYGDFDVKGSN